MAIVNNKMTIASGSKLVLTQGYQRAVQQLSPLAYWRMSNSTTQVDIISGNNTTLTGTTTTGQTGAISSDTNKSVLFAGGRGDAGHPSAYNNLKTFSISCFIKLTATPDGNFRTLISQNNGSSLAGANRYILTWVTGNPATIGFEFWPDSSNRALSWTSTTISTATWYHIVMTYDDAGDRKGRIYINGADSSYSFQTAATGTTKDASAFDWCIGNVPATGEPSGISWDGNIDEVAIFGTQLSASNVLALYNAST